MTETSKVIPFRPGSCQLAEHKYRRHNVTVPTAVANLENHELWTHVAVTLSPGDSVRVLAEDFSMVAELIVTFRQGTVAKLVQVWRKDLEAVDQSADAVEGKFVVRLRGPKKWCIVNNETSEVVKELIPTQAAAFKELEEYLRALAS